MPIEQLFKTLEERKPSLPSEDIATSKRRRSLTPLAIAARRRNAQKSTGPRTAAGKRRSALNSLQQGLCSPYREALLPLYGEDPREFRRVQRDLISLLQPDSDLRGLVEDLAQAWLDKAGILRARPRPFGYDAATWKINREIEEKLMGFIHALSLGSRKWFYLLENSLGGPLPSTAELRMRIEARMSTFKGLAEVSAFKDSCGSSEARG